MIKFSNCKINIGLDVIRRRPDNYHDIVTAMVQVPWHDAIEILPSERGVNTLQVYGNKVDCPPEKNLVMKAAVAMQNEYELPPFDIYLQKNIPDGAGLGGGSGDAATTILLINEVCDLRLSKEEMAKIAARLGADCPFFIYEEPMLATGIGTELRPIDIDLKGYVLAITKPADVSISTKEAYAGIKPQMPAEDLLNLLRLPIEEWQGRIKNDFEQSVFAIAPSVKKTKEDMLQQGAVYASMSGSGAAVYGIFYPGSNPKAQFVCTL